MRFQIVVDGAYGNWYEQRVRQILPGANVASISSIIDPWLRNQPTLSSFAHTHPLGKKLALLLASQESGAVVFSDSDVLAFRNPTDLYSSIEKGRPCYNAEASDPAYDAEIINRARSMKIAPCPKLNSGLLHVPHKSLDIPLAANLLTNLLHHPFSWFTEQTVLALLLGLADAVALPTDKYIVSNCRQFYWQPDVDYGQIRSRHFTGTTRHLLYLKGLPALLRETP